MLSLKSILLTDPSPVLRYLVLKNIFNKKDDDPELLELRKSFDTDQRLSECLSLQQKNGSWERLSKEDHITVSPLILTSAALCRLSFFGFTQKDECIKKAADYLIRLRSRDGSWPLRAADAITLNKGYSWVPLQTALPLRGLGAIGYAADPLLSSSYIWLLEKMLPDGAWPAGWAGNNYGFIAGYRRMPHSRWACRSNTTGALLALSYHPEYKVSEPVKKTLDMLLARETKDVANIGHDHGRIMGFEPLRGFFTYFAKYDPLLTLQLCSRIGADKNDQRVKNIIELLLSSCNNSGLFEYRQKPHFSKWLSYEILRTIESIADSSEWQSNEPSTPFQAYPKSNKRF